MLRRASIALAAAAFAAAPALGQNLFTNSGFEAGDFTGWTSGPSPTFDGMIVGIEGTSIPPHANTLKVRSGTYAAAANSAGRCSLAQSVTVVPDASYLVGGWVTIGASGGGSNASISIGDPTAGNVVTHSFPVSGSPVPRFIRVSRIYRSGPMQTSATLSFSGSSSYRLSIDDMVLSPWTPPAAPGSSRRIVATQQTLPGLPPALSQISSPVLSPTGRVAVLASGPNALVYADGGAAYVAAAPGAPTQGNGTVFSLFGPLSVNDDGATAFHGATTGAKAANGIFTHDDVGGVQPLVKETTPAPGGNGTIASFSHEMSFTRAGVAFMAFLAGTTGGLAADEGIFFKPAAGPLRTIAREGDPAPGGGTYQAAGVARIAMNNAGSIAFVHGTAAFEYGAFIDTGGGPQRLGSAAFNTRPSINENNEVAWLDTPAGGGQVVRFWSSAATSPLVALGDAAPGGSSFAALRDPVVNDAGQVAFAAGLADGTSGVFRTDAEGNTTVIARTGQTAPDGGVFRDFVFSGSSGNAPPRRPAILAGGQVAFASFGADTPEVAIYLADASETIAVAGWGQSLGDRVITGFRWQVEPDLAVNDDGQVAYNAVLDDGRSAVELFTPTLRWRSTQPGAWSNSNNWTVGLAPAAVHPVIIDSPAGVDVTLPSGSTAVKSLEVGAGNALTLSPGSDLTAADGVVIDAGAFLKGSGTIHGDVTSAGTLAPGSSAGTMTIDGDYTQTGTLELELLADGFDQLLVTGTLTLGGDIIVTGSADPGQQFNLVSAAAFTGTANWHLPGESSFQLISLPGGGQTMQITYVPDPASLSLVMIPLIVLRRSRRL